MANRKLNNALETKTIFSFRRLLGDVINHFLRVCSLFSILVVAIFGTAFNFKFAEFF